MLLRVFLDMPNRRTGQSIERDGKVASYILSYTKLAFASICNINKISAFSVAKNNQEKQQKLFRVLQKKITFAFGKAVSYPQHHKLHTNK